MEFTSVKDAETIKQVEALAREIWTEHYIPIIGTEQVNYMLREFQSAASIGEQLRSGFYYDLLLIDGFPCAYLAYRDEPDHCFLSKLYVLASHRSRGLGRLALNRVIVHARRQGLAQIRLTVNRRNATALKAYSGMDFRNVGELLTPIGEAYVMDDYLMQLDI